MSRVGLLSVVGLALLSILERPAPAHAQVSFSDVPFGNRALYRAVQDLAAKGILRGSPEGTFDGMRPMTRGECFLAFNRILDWFHGQLVNTPPPYPRAPLPAPLIAGKPFADVPTNKDSEMGDAVSILDRLGLLNGYPDQTLRLRRPLTRSEFEVLVQSLQQWLDHEMVALGFAPPEVPPEGRRRK